MLGNSSRSRRNSPVSLTIPVFTVSLALSMGTGLQWASSPSDIILWRCTLPWYWTDDLARVLLDSGLISESVASDLMAIPVAYRSEESTVEAAASALQEDEEIPLAA